MNLDRIASALRIRKWQYLASGILRRLGQERRCPTCHGKKGQRVDRKFFHTLFECSACGVLYRWPNENAAELENYYQSDYDEPGLTTELPSPEALAAMKENCFRDSGKDFSYHIEILKALQIQPGMRILDFGANWGYASYQFKQAGFETDSFEISRPRAAFGRHLDLDIWTDINRITGPYDAVYSSHVLEHLANPLDDLVRQLRWVKPGGLVIAHTPNGSGPFRSAHWNSFHKLWGQVHPILITDRFIRNRFGHLPHYVSSVDLPDEVKNWSQTGPQIGDLSGPGLFIVLKKLEE